MFVNGECEWIVDRFGEKELLVGARAKSSKIVHWNDFEWNLQEVGRLLSEVAFPISKQLLVRDGVAFQTSSGRGGNFLCKCRYRARIKAST